MQTDMHFYGTYALARAAGLTRRAAGTIANCSEYVDDAVLDRDIQFADGRAILPEMTAHRMIDYRNASADDQRRVWLPFHFLPGGEGEGFAAKLVCRKNSRVAKAMARRNLDVAVSAPYGLHLMGITAHVYGDTFAHYGFIGASHPLNGIDAASIALTVRDRDILDYVTGKAEAMRNRILAAALSLVFPLGHGAAATYPDRPYLTWQYRRLADGVLVRRDNPRDFLQGCQVLHGLFTRFAAGAPRHGDPDAARSWARLRPVIRRILAVEGNKARRIKAWKGAMENGALFGRAERPPRYRGTAWSEALHDWRRNPDRAPARLLSSDVHRFFRAARTHRNMVLTDLLPEFGLMAA